MLKCLKKSISKLVLLSLFCLLATSCQNNSSENFAKKAEQQAQTATTIEDWKAVDELWRQAIVALPDEDHTLSQFSELNDLYSQNRLDVLLKIALLSDSEVPCGTTVPQSGRDKPQYWGKVGYVTASYWQEPKLFEDIVVAIQNQSINQRVFRVPIVRWIEEERPLEVPLGTRVQIIKTSLEHEGYGTYTGTLLVRDIETTEIFWIKPLNFSLTNPSRCLAEEDPRK